MVHPIRRFPILLVLLTLLSLAACGGGSTTTRSQATATPGPVTLHIFAAASLTESFNEIKTQYQNAHHDIQLVYNFNGSQALEQQIANGADADIFASADQANMQKATKANLVNTPQVFAKNRLVVIVPNGDTTVTSLKDLAKEGTKIDMGTAAVPAGKYGLQILDKMGKDASYGSSYESAVKANVVSQEENVKAVVQKVQLGEVDAGFVYRTDVTAAVASKVKVIDIPDNLNVIAQYPIATTKNTKNASAAQAFIAYVESTAGETVLEKYHFIAPAS